MTSLSKIVILMG